MDKKRTIEDLLARFPFLSSLVIVTIVFGGLLLVVTPIFETTDDSYMKGIVSGTFCADSPSELMVYSNVLIGHVLKVLYTKAPQIPWYAYYLIGTQYIAYTLLLWAFLIVASRGDVVGYFIIGMIGFGSRFLWHLSFTTTAFLAVEAGIVVIVAHGFRDQIKLWQTARAGILGGLLIVVGSLIRWRMFAVVSLLSAPLVAFVLLWKTGRRNLAYYLVLGVLSLSLVQGAALYDQAIYQASPAWVQFQRVNTYSYWIADLAKPRELQIHPEETHEILQKVGWSPNDFLMANNWFFMDPDVYSEQALRECGQDWMQLQSGSPQMVAASVIAMYWVHLTSQLGLVCIVVSLFAMVLCGPGRLRIHSALTWGIALVLMGWLSATQKLPERVALPVMVVSMITSLMLNLLKRPDADTTVKCDSLIQWKNWIAGVAIILLTLSVVEGYRRQIAYLMSHDHFWRDMQQIAERGDELVVFWAPFPYGLMLPFDDLRGMGRMALCVLGAVERTPHSQLQLSNRGVVNVMQKISQGRSVAILGGPENIQLLSRFIDEHYGITLKFSRAFRGRSGLTLFEIKQVENN